jgi:hypothetical protein
MRLPLLCSLVLYSLASAHPGQNSQVALTGKEGDKGDALLYLYRNLVETSSITGSEHNVTHYLSDYLQAHGFNVEL